MGVKIKKRRLKNLEVSKTRNKVYYRVAKGARILLPQEIGSPEFMAAYEFAAKSYPEPLPAIKRPRSVDYAKTEANRRLSVALKTCRSRANKRGWEFDLDEEWLCGEMERQGHRCALTGIPFLSRFEQKTKVHPYTPSIDRIDSSKGYTKENCRVVVFAINAMMMDWGEKTFAQVAKSYRSNGIKSQQARPRRNPASPRTQSNPRESTP